MAKSTLFDLMKKDLQYKPFRPITVQYLSPEDKQNRVIACRRILNAFRVKNARNETFFTDECSIYADGKSKTVVWAKENPYYYEQIKQYPPHIMVWCAISAKCLIGPFICHGRITSENYIQMLQDQFLPALRQQRIHNEICSSSW